MSFADRRRWPRFPQRADRRLSARAAHRRMTPARGERVQVAISRQFAFPLRRAYDTNLGRWPEYWPGLIRVEPGAALVTAGGHCEADAEATRPPDGARDHPAARRPIPAHRVHERPAWPAHRARHERHLVEDHASFGYRIVVEFEPRTGLRRPSDRVVVARAVERVAGRTVRNLEQRFAELSARDDERPMGVRSR